MDYAPAKLAVGNALDPHLALQLNYPSDCLVLDNSQLLRCRLAFLELLALLKELRGTLERSNVVRAERREELRASSGHQSTDWVISKSVVGGEQETQWRELAPSRL